MTKIWKETGNRSMKKIEKETGNIKYNKCCPRFWGLELRGRGSTH
jgi:hypothetical protein